MGSWYYKKGSSDIGPLSDKELAQAYLSGIFSDDTPVRKEGIEKWISFNRLKSYGKLKKYKLSKNDRVITSSHPDNGDMRAESGDGRLVYDSSIKSHSDDAFDEEINLAEYWRTITRHKWGIGGMIFVFTLIGALSAFSIKPTYRAAVTMLVEPEQPKIISLDPMSSTTNIMFFYETQYDVIRSRSVAEAVIYKLKLYDNPEFTGKRSGSLVFDWRELISEQWRRYFQEDKNLFTPLESNQVSEEIGAAMKSRLEESFSVGARQQGARPLQISLQAQKALAKLMKRFKDRLSIGGEKNSQIVLIKFDSYDPQLAADIANAVATAYMELGLESRLSVVKQATSWLTSRLVDLRQKLALSEKALQEFQVREGVIDTKSRQDIVSKKLSGITEQLVKAQTILIEAEIRYNQMRKIKQNGGSYEALRPVLENNFIQTLKEEEARLIRQAGELAERYGAKHPKIIAVKSDLKEAQNHLKLEISKVVEGIEKEYEVAKENDRRLRVLSEQIKSKMRSDTGREFELAKLERNVATNRQLYGIFLTRSKETNVEGNTDVTNVRIIDRAYPPVKPVKPKKALITLIAMFVGLFTGMLLAFVREHLDNTFKTPDDVEQELHLPVLGIVPQINKSDLERFLAKRDILTQFLEPFTEMIRNIRTSILFSNMDHPPKTILVTSAVPSEGKTTLSCSIALSFSQIGRTLLVEADLRKPAQAKMMGLSETLGLADIVSGHATIEEAIKNDPKYQNISYLAGKVSSSSPLEILSSRKFSSMLDDLKAHFDYIIIDTAPVVMFSDALVISHLADYSLMVVKADSTTHNIVKDALKRFSAIHLKPVGVVLTHVNTRDLGGYGHAYYNYGSYISKDSA